MVRRPTMARRTFSARGPRVSKHWSGADTGGSGIVLTVTQALILFFVAAGDPFTVLRSRGNIFVTATPDAADDDDVIGFGIIVATDQAVAAGGASLPGPIADPDADWLWHQYVPMSARALTAYAGDAIGLNARVEIDSKAMRRGTTNQQTVLIGELSSGQFSSVIAHAGFRLLATHN